MAFRNNNLDLQIQTGTYGYNSFGGCMLPVRKGDTLQYVKESTVTVESVKLHRLRG